MAESCYRYSSTSAKTLEINCLTFCPKHLSADICSSWAFCHCKFGLRISFSNERSAIHRSHNEHRTCRSVNAGPSVTDLRTPLCIFICASALHSMISVHTRQLNFTTIRYMSTDTLQ